MIKKDVRIAITLMLLFFFFKNSYAQLTDLARLEYSFIPKSRSEDRYTRLRALFNYPIELKNKAYLIVGGEYNNILLNLGDEYPFDVENLDNIHVIDLNIGYTFKWNEKWRFGARFNPRIASTLSESITREDFFLNGGIFAITDRTKDTSLKRPYRLIVGLTYNATVGIPYPLPFVSYFRRINENWSFNAGVPKSNIKYSINAQNHFQAFLGLDGYFANLQKPMIVNGRNADHISLSVVVGGFGYEYCFTKHLVAYVYTGYTFRLNNVLRNEDQDEIFKLDNVNSFYLRSGLKFKI